MRRIVRLPLALLLIGAAASATAGAADPASLAKEAEALYRKGACAEAVKKYEAAMAAGASGAALFYQAGQCYGQSLGNKEKGLELKKRALPLLEGEIAAGGAGVDSYYYLASIQINDLNDPVKGTDVARRGVAALEKSKGGAPLPADSLFRAGRLYTFLGKDAEAAAWYERFSSAAAASPDAVDRQALRVALEAIASERMRQKDWTRAAAAWEKLVQMDPLRDEARHQMGRALVYAGRPQEAASAWRRAHSDELRTELNYLAAVVERWAAAGSPAASKLAAKPESLSDEDLRKKIVEAADPLRKIRQKDDEERKAREEKERAAREQAEKARETDPEKIRAIFKAKMKSAPPPPDPDAAETAPAGPAGALQGMGLPAPAAPALPPVSAERAAAEKDFFALMIEMVKRGRLIRNFCFENGLVEILFR